MIKNFAYKNILIASLQPWNYPMVSKHYITLELARLQNNIVFLSLYIYVKDFFLVTQSKYSQFHDIRPKAVDVKTLKVLPGFLRNSSFYSIAKRSMRQTLGADYQPDIVILFDPQFHGLFELYPKALKVYYCVDHMSVNKTLERAENKILRSMDVAIAASKRLYNDLQIKHSNVIHLPHGVSLLEEYEDREWKDKIDSWFKKFSNRPVFGFVGKVGNEVDFGIMQYVARENPTSLIALIGPIMPAVKAKVAELPPNVYCAGPVPTIAVKYCLNNFDVGLVPYVTNHYNSRRNPIKIMQYIAAGLPVVSTISSHDYVEDRFIFQARSPEEFNEKLKCAYEKRDKQMTKNRAKWKEENSWRQRIELLDVVIERHKSPLGLR